MIEHTPVVIPRVDCLTSTIRRTVWDGAGTRSRDTQRLVNGAVSLGGAVTRVTASR